jgi:predicted dehydrogenase
LGVHFLDLVHYITGATFPVSSVCQGGTFTWNDEHQFTCPDQAQATWIYPEGFMVSYSSNFGNPGGNSFKIFGENGMIDCVDWDRPMLTGQCSKKGTACVAEPEKVEHVSRPNHIENWLTCLRTRETPHAPIEAGYQHAVAAILAMAALDKGRRMLYDAEKREISEG